MASTASCWDLVSSSDLERWVWRGGLENPVLTSYLPMSGSHQLGLCCNLCFSCCIYIFVLPHRSLADSPMCVMPPQLPSGAKIPLQLIGRYISSIIPNYFHMVACL
jgi:hypothetical protein